MALTKADLHNKLEEQSDQLAGLRATNDKHEASLSEQAVLINQAQNLLKRLEKRQSSTEQLVNLGFLVIGITTLGVSIAFLQLVVQVYQFLRFEG